MEWGPDNTFTKVDTGAGAVPIQDGGNSITVDDGAGSLTVDGTVTANLAAGTNNIGDVDVLTIPAPLSTTGGGTEATALRVTVANDSTGVLSVDDNGGSLTIDGNVGITGSVDTELTTADLDTGVGTDTRAVVGLVLAASGGGLLVGAANPIPVSDNAGSLTVDGTVTANLAAGTNNIGDVDVLTVPAPLSTSGGGTEATALRVTVATDSTGVLSVDDNGGSLTVDGAVTANAGTGDFLSVAAHTRNEAFKEANAIGGELDDTTPVAATEGNISPARITPQRALHVNLRDNSGAEVSVGGGTQYDEDTVHVSGDKVTMAGVVQQSADAALSTDGDRSLLQVDASGFLKVNVKAGGSGGTQYVEDDVAAANPTGTALIVVRNDARSGSLVTADGDNVAVRGTNNGELYVKHVDAITANAGTNLNTSALALEAGNLATVAGAVRAEDAASADGHTGIGALAVRKATPANTSGADGDYEFLQVSAGRLWASATIDTALPAGTNNIGDIDVLTLPASNKTLKRAVGNATTSGDNTVIAAPGVSKVIKVISYALQGVGVVNAKFTDGAAGTQLSMLWNLQAREGAYAQPTVIPQYHFKCTANTALILNCSSTAGVGFEITYWDDDAA